MSALTRRANVGQRKKNGKGTKTNNELAHGDHLGSHLGHHVVHLGVGQMASIRRIELPHFLLVLVEESFVGGVVQLGGGRQTALLLVSLLELSLGWQQLVVIALFEAGWVSAALVDGRRGRNHRVK